jgi:hypothetical protein
MISPPPAATQSRSSASRFGAESERSKVSGERSSEFDPISLRMTTSYPFNSTIVVGNASGAR